MGHRWRPSACLSVNLHLWKVKIRKEQEKQTSISIIPLNISCTCLCLKYKYVMLYYVVKLCGPSNVWKEQLPLWGVYSYSQNSSFVKHFTKRQQRQRNQSHICYADTKCTYVLVNLTIAACMAFSCTCSGSRQKMLMRYSSSIGLPESWKPARIWNKTLWVKLCSNMTLCIIKMF